MESKRWINEYADIGLVHIHISIEACMRVYRTACTPVCNISTFSYISLDLSMRTIIYYVPYPPRHTFSSSYSFLITMKNLNVFLPTDGARALSPSNTSTESWEQLEKIISNSKSVNDRVTWLTKKNQSEEEKTSLNIRIRLDCCEKWNEPMSLGIYMAPGLWWSSCRMCWLGNCMDSVEMQWLHQCHQL